MSAHTHNALTTTDDLEPDAPLKWNDRTCRVCGCDDEHACDPACFWIEFDLCSACYESMPAPVSGGDHVDTHVDPVRFARLYLKSEILATLSEAALTVAEMARDAGDDRAADIALATVNLAAGESVVWSSSLDVDAADIMAVLDWPTETLSGAAIRLMHATRYAWELAA